MVRHKRQAEQIPSPEGVTSPEELALPRPRTGGHATHGDGVHALRGGGVKFEVRSDNEGKGIEETCETRTRDGRKVHYLCVFSR